MRLGMTMMGPDGGMMMMTIEDFVGRAWCFVGEV